MSLTKRWDYMHVLFRYVPLSMSLTKRWDYEKKVSEVEQLECKYICVTNPKRFLWISCSKRKVRHSVAWVPYI